MDLASSSNAARCAHCGNQLPAGARFCPECGRALSSRCPRCDAQVAGDHRFCPSCGSPVPSNIDSLVHTPRHLTERILAGRGDLVGERKQVTVLFADIVGSTRLVRDMDPEEASALISPVVDAMMAAVHHFEGTVTQVAGDGIMALFGAPLAVEDHAVRACCAAVEIPVRVARDTGGRVQVRVGLHSGDVLVKTISKDLSIDYTAVGATVHLAARLEEAAPPGGVLATTTTVDLARGFIDARAVGLVSIAGYADPVEVHEIRGVRTVQSTWQARSERTLTPFVRREREMDVLRRALAAASEGTGQVVAVVGQAGVGKSRLLHEFVVACRSDRCRVLSGGATSYDTLTPYQPLKGVIRDWADARAGEGVESALERAVAGLEGLPASAVPALTAMLDARPSDPVWARLEPRQRRRAMRDAVRSVLLSEAGRGSWVVLLEDLHWIDSETQAVLDDLVDSLGTSRLLLIVTHRPEYEPAWATMPCYTRLQVDPLRGAEADEFLDALLGRDQSVAALGSDLLARTEGTPLFLEEWVRALVEEGRLIGASGRYRMVDGSTAVDVPSTVQTVIAARVDRLGSASKSVLRVASVVGEHVPFDLLASLCDVDDLDGTLRRLQAADFLRLTSAQRPREWTFRHNLIREVVYRSTPLDLRRQMHGAVADALARIRPEQTERLAHHTWKAQRWSAAAGYSREAGDKAITRSAYPAARRFFDQALRAIAKAPQDTEHLQLAVDVRLSQRVAVMATGGRLADSLSGLSQASAIAVRIGDPRRQALAEIHRSYAASTMGDNHIGVQAGEVALAVARDIGDMALSSEARIAIAQAHVYAGRWEPVTDLLLSDLGVLMADAHRLERRGQAATRSLMSLSLLALANALAGRDAEAVRYVEQAEQVAQESARPLDRAHVLWTAGSVDRHAERAHDAVRRLAAGHVLALEHDLTFWSTVLGPALAAAMAAAGRHDEAEETVALTFGRAMATGFPMAQTRALVYAAEVEIALGRSEQGRVHAQQALHHAAGFDHPLYEAYALRSLAIALTGLGQPERAGPTLMASLRLAESLRARPLITRLREDLDGLGVPNV